MDNQEFCEVITRSFKTFLKTSSRSNEKLKILHRAIAKDLLNRLCVENKNYEIYALGLEGVYGREASLNGRYMDKKIDIAIKLGDEFVAGIGVKFIMQNYAQNANNYFENMLGETSNIRSAGFLYFQIFIIPEHLPYYDKEGGFDHWEQFSDVHLKKYCALAKDNVHKFYHTPDKTLLVTLQMPPIAAPLSRRQYGVAYENCDTLMVGEQCSGFDDPYTSVIFNDYETFIRKVTHSILAV